MAMPDAQLGELGEQEARGRLERALLGCGLRFSGFADKGIDLIMQFESPAPDGQPLHFGVQVKTGTSFASGSGAKWLVKNISESRFRQWTKSKLPVIFVWVRPTQPAECYWTIIRRTTSRSHFSIPKRSVINPGMRFQLALEVSVDPGEAVASGPIKLLRPPLGIGLRPFARKFYKTHLMPSRPVHPILGPISFSWRGWRHLTRQGRRQDFIHQSLQLLPATIQAIQSPSELVGLRHLKTLQRGHWTTELRLVVFRSRSVKVLGRRSADLVLVIRQRIRFPTNWLGDVSLHQRIYCESSFESIYEDKTTK